MLRVSEAAKLAEGLFSTQRNRESSPTMHKPSVMMVPVLGGGGRRIRKFKPFLDRHVLYGKPLSPNNNLKIKWLVSAIANKMC